MSGVINLFICLAVPLVLFLLVADKKMRVPIMFVLAGMLTALISVALNSNAQGLYSYSDLQVGLYCAPFNEELVKIIPLLLYVFIRKPDLKSSITVAVAIGVGFATLENIVYLMSYGVSNITLILIRGFSTGIMHSITLCIFSVFLYRLSNLRILREIYLLFGVYSFSVAFHGLFNLLVNSDLYAAIMCGYFMPPVVAIGFIIFQKWDYITAFFNKLHRKRKIPE